MEINQIKRITAAPVSFVGRPCLSLEPRKKDHALKNVTNNEEYFNGHFRERPVMPGVLIIGSMAQAAVWHCW